MGATQAVVEVGEGRQPKAAVAACNGQALPASFLPKTLPDAQIREPIQAISIVGVEAKVCLNRGMAVGQKLVGRKKPSVLTRFKTGKVSPVRLDGVGHQLPQSIARDFVMACVGTQHNMLCFSVKPPGSLGSVAAVSVHVSPRVPGWG